eukprot:TRINITY_DN344_c0_g1_i1.p1 TRINITY_DN344_c0_g1~~TRINITY_DN344_c0_g1_i1.p1  ORF type:complete len:216 (+),score=74.38 TRINITY_DN344_c0_g1_i1:162-809(+)
MESSKLSTFDMKHLAYLKNVEERKKNGETITRGEGLIFRTIYLSSAAGFIGGFGSWFKQIIAFNELMVQRTKGIEFGKKIEPMKVSSNEAKLQIYKTMLVSVRRWALPTLVWSVTEGMADFTGSVNFPNNSLPSSLIGSVFAGYTAFLQRGRGREGFKVFGLFTVFSLFKEYLWESFKTNSLKRVYAIHAIEEEKARVRRNRHLTKTETTDPLHL